MNVTEGADVRTGKTALQLARILALLLLMRATGWYVVAIHQGVTRLQMDQLWRPWAAVSLVSVLFVVVVLVGRRHRHPWVVLAVEAVVAAVLAFVPPWQWVIWFGLSGWSNAMVGGFVQPLAVAWLVAVVLRGFHQLRDADRPVPQPADGGPTTSDGSDEIRRVISSEP